MSDERRSDAIILGWIRSGPELAGAEFVERTLLPIPRMRQRRSWRIALGALGRPVGALVGVAAVIVVAVAGLSLITVFSGTGGRITPPSVAPPMSLEPAFELVLGEGPAAQRFTSDPEASVSTCLGDDDGSWSVLYAGGDPFVSLDLVVGSGTDRPSGASRVGAELTAGDTYVRFDPAVLRGGDPPGRSEATVAVSHVGPATTFIVHATTPNRSTGDDGPPIAVSLELTCAPAP
jgi:hypothetical protein